MNIVFIGIHDWSNTCNRISRSINRAEGDLCARVVTLYKHPFGYPDQDICLFEDTGAVIDYNVPMHYQWFQERWNEANALLHDAQWLCLSGDGEYPHTASLLEKFGIAMGEKPWRWAGRHAGSRFRNNVERYQKLDREWNLERRFVAADLYRFVKDDPGAFVFTQPQDHFADEPRPDADVLRVCHTPSNPEKKGTDKILSAMEVFADRGEVDFHMWTKLPFEEMYKLRNSCDVYIDQHWPHCGGPGGSIMEALANGVAVISNISKVIPAAFSLIPRPPILPVHETSDITQWVEKLADDRVFLRERKALSLAWAKKYLAPQFTHDYWQRCLA